MSDSFNNETYNQRDKRGCLGDTARRSQAAKQEDIRRCRIFIKITGGFPTEEAKDDIPLWQVERLEREDSNVNWRAWLEAGR